VPGPHPLEPDDPERIGEYRVTARLGAGGQGVVYLCTGPDGRNVAIKRLHPWFSGTVRGRQLFAREIDAASRVARYTARVLRSGEHAGRPYIVSEYIAGESVQERVDRTGPYALTELRMLSAETASALAAIHDAGFVQCDVKPANILAAHDGARIIDFGIARALNTIANHNHELGGTPAYMAPEQITGDPIGPRTDVFAWASTMVFAATGTPPFGLSGDEYGRGVMYRIVNHEPALDRIPEPLRDVLEVCLLKNPAKRPSAREVVSMLNQQTKTSPQPAATRVGEPLTGHTAPITCVSLDETRPIAITGSHDQTARLWDLSALRRQGPPLRHDSPVLAVACGRLADRTIAVTGCQDHTLNIWDLTTGTRIGKPLQGHNGAVVSIALSVLDDHLIAVTASEDRSVRLWDLTEQCQLGPSLVDNNSVMSVACYELDGRPTAVVGGAWDRSLRTLDLADRHQTVRPLIGHTDSVMSVACGSLSNRPIAITGGYDQTVRIWDLTTRHETGPPLVHKSAVMSVTFGMRGDRPTVLTSAADHAVRVWDLTTRQQVGDPISAEPPVAGPFVPVAFNEATAVICNEDLAISVWRLHTQV
jgi:eukaryotic-like serine/threonine-protein kinase